MTDDVIFITPYFPWVVDQFVKFCINRLSGFSYMPAAGFMVRVVGLRSKDPVFKSHLVVELIPGGVDSAGHPSEVDKMSASLLVSCVGVATCPVLYPIAKETA